MIDLVAQGPEGQWALIMIEDREWPPSVDRLADLQAKLNSYLQYALDGQLAEDYPLSVGKPLEIQLHCVDDCSGPPEDHETAAFLARVAEVAEGAGMGFTVEGL